MLEYNIHKHNILLRLSLKLEVHSSSKVVEQRHSGWVEDKQGDYCSSRSAPSQWWDLLTMNSAARIKVLSGCGDQCTWGCVHNLHMHGFSNTRQFHSTWGCVHMPGFSNVEAALAVMCLWGVSITPWSCLLPRIDDEQLFIISRSCSGNVRRWSLVEFDDCCSRTVQKLIQ